MKECGEAITSAMNTDLSPNLSSNILAVSLVGDLEAMATLIPRSLRVFNIPLA